MLAPCFRMSRLRAPSLLCAGIVGLYLGAMSAPANAAPREPVDVDACVSMHDDFVSETTIEAKMSSSCERSLRCEVSWTLACNNGHAPAKHTKKFTLGAGARATTRISAAICHNDEWEIEELNWSCREA